MEGTRTCIEGTPMYRKQSRIYEMYLPLTTKMSDGDIRLPRIVLYWVSTCKSKNYLNTTRPTKPRHHTI